MALFTDSSSAVRRRSEVVFWCFAGFMLLIFLGHNALWGLEGRCAEVVREMLLSMDFFHPEINGVAETVRPPLSYWATLPAAILFGADEFTLRLPAVLAALVLLWATRMIARKLFDEQTSLVSMWILFSTYGFIFWGRVAAPDMANAAAAACAVMIFLYWEEKPTLANYIAFYLLLALGTLFKGIPMVGVVLLLILPVAVVRGNLKRYIDFRHAFALALGVAIGLMPYLYSYVADGGSVGRAAANSGVDMFWKTQVLRILDARYSGESVYSYLFNLPRIILPWSAVFAVGVYGFVKFRKELTKEFSALLLGMVLAFGLFCISGSRRWYYLLPLVPFCSIVIAAALCGWTDKMPGLELTIRIMRFCLLIVSSTALVLPVAIPLQGIVPHYRIPFGVFVCCCAAGAVSLLIYMLDQDEDNATAGFFGMPHKTASLVVGISVMFTAGFAAVLPQFTLYRTEKPFLTSLRRELEGIDPDDIMIYGDDTNGRVIFYLNLQRPVKNDKQLAAFLMSKRSQRIAVIAENGKQVYSGIAGELDKLTVRPFDPGRPHFSEQHLPHEAENKKKLAAWIFDVPENLCRK